MKRHPLSEVWGDMPPEQFEELVEDVREHGVRDPIVCHHEKILDGWHRYRAASKAEKACRFIPLPEGEEPVGFVIRRNAYRRHLTVSQRAAAIVACCEWGQHGGHRRSEIFKWHPVPLENGGKPSTIAETAAKSGIGERTLRYAHEAREGGLLDKVASGEMSAKVAARQARGKPAKPKPPTKLDQLETTLIGAKQEIKKRTARIEELEEHLAFLRGCFDEETEAQYERLRKQIVTLKMSVDHWITKFQESNNENKFLRKRLRELGVAIRP